MLEEASRDNLEFLKEKALKAIAQLLLAKPEQEARLLSALVNKLGDPSRKLASKVDIPLLTFRCLHVLCILRSIYVGNQVSQAFAIRSMGSKSCHLTCVCINAISLRG